jgi:hypothetical protein
MHKLKKLSYSSVILLIGICLTSLAIADSLFALHISGSGNIKATMGLELRKSSDNTVVTSYSFGSIQKPSQTVMFNEPVRLYNIGNSIVTVAWSENMNTGMYNSIKDNGNVWNKGLTFTKTIPIGGYIQLTITLIVEDIAPLGPFDTQITFDIIG